MNNRKLENKPDATGYTGLIGFQQLISGQYKWVKSTMTAFVAQINAASTGAIGELKRVPNISSLASWLLCDGSAVSRTTYANLYAAIGTKYGSGDGSTTFNLPNLLETPSTALAYTLHGTASAASVADIRSSANSLLTLTGATLVAGEDYTLTGLSDLSVLNSVTLTALNTTQFNCTSALLYTSGEYAVDTDGRLTLADIEETATITVTLSSDSTTQTATKIVATPTSPFLSSVLCTLTGVTLTADEDYRLTNVGATILATINESVLRENDGKLEVTEDLIKDFYDLGLYTPSLTASIPVQIVGKPNSVASQTYNTFIKY